MKPAARLPECAHNEPLTVIHKWEIDKIPFTIAAVHLQMFWEQGIATIDLDRNLRGFFHLDDFRAFLIVEVGCHILIHADRNAGRVRGLASHHQQSGHFDSHALAVLTSPRPWQQGHRNRHFA